MIIIGSQPITAPDGRPIRPARRTGVAGAASSSPSRRAARVAIAAAVGATCFGGGLSLALLGDDGTSTPGPRAVPSVVGEPHRTELDARGVPVWWTEV